MSSTKHQPPPLWRERVFLTDVKQHNGELWLRVSACNAPEHTPPMGCFLPGQVLVIEIQRDPVGPHGSSHKFTSK